MPKKLKQLTVTAVSLVPRGSNPDSHIAFFKADATHAPVTVPVQDVEKATFNDLLLAEQRRKALYKLADSIYTMQDAMYSAIYADNPSADIRKSVDQFSVYVNKLLDALDSNSLDGDADVAKQLVLKKAEGVFARFFHQEPQTMSKTIATPPAAATGTPETPPQEINLAELPAHVQEFVKAQRAQTEQAIATAKAAQEAADRATAAVEIEKEARELLQFEGVAKTELANLPGTPAEKAAILLSLSKGLKTEDYEKAFNLIKAGAAAMTAQTQATGIADTSTAGLAKAGTELEQFFDAEAAKLMAAEKGLSKSQALVKAYRANKQQYNLLKEEERARGQRLA